MELRLYVNSGDGYESRGGSWDWMFIKYSVDHRDCLQCLGVIRSWSRRCLGGKMLERARLTAAVQREHQVSTGFHHRTCVRSSFNPCMSHHTYSSATGCGMHDRSRKKKKGANSVPDYRHVQVSRWLCRGDGRQRQYEDRPWLPTD